MGLMDVLRYIVKTFPAIAKSASEAYSELGQTPKMELFVKKAASQMFVWVLNTPLKMATHFVSLSHVKQYKKLRSHNQNTRAKNLPLPETKTWLMPE